MSTKHSEENKFWKILTETFISCRDKRIFDIQRPQWMTCDVIKNQYSEIT